MIEDPENAQKCSKGNTIPLSISEGTPKKRSAPERRRDWLFTSYNMEIEPIFCDRMKYLLYAPEVCPTTGRPHWQGFVYYFDKVSMKLSNKCITGGNHHHDPINGTYEECEVYIKGPYTSPDGSKTKPFNAKFREHGTFPQQGKRTDLDTLKTQILGGIIKCDNILIEQPEMYHQYGRTLDKIEDLRMSKEFRTEMTEGIWYWGPTGVGKSHKAFENFTPETHYVVPNDCGWWDQYKQQPIVIINDFRGWIPYNEMLQMVDKWPYSVKRRGRPPLPFTSKKVIITSSLKPEDVYHHRDDEDDIEQLRRRFNIIKLDGPSR